MSYNKSLICCLLVTAGPYAHGMSQLEAELQNIRQIPFGYVASCQDGHLKIEGPKSATYWIRSAEVCANQPNEFQFCIAGASGEDPKSGRQIPNCAELKVEVI